MPPDKYLRICDPANPAHCHQKAKCVPHISKKKCVEISATTLEELLDFLQKNFFTWETLFSSKKRGITKKEFVFTKDF